MVVLDARDCQVAMVHLPHSDNFALQNGSVWDPVIQVSSSELGVLSVLFEHKTISALM